MAKTTDTSVAGELSTASPTFELNTNLHDIFHTNEALEEDGAWVTVNDFLGIKVKIRRLRSEAVVKAFEKIVRETYSDGEELARNPQGMSEEQSMLVLKRQLAEAVLIDWKGIRDKKTGEEIPYSPQAALQMMNMKDFREFVYEKANSRDTFREEFVKAGEGNS